MKPAIKTNAPPVEIAPGYAVLNLSGATGGVTHKTTPINDTRRARHGRRTEVKVVRTTDNETVVREIDAVIKHVDDTVFRHLCVKMTFGHFLPAVNADELHRQIAELRNKIDALNAGAEAMGSRHRGRVGVLTPALNVEDPNLVLECRRTVLAALGDVYDALCAGDIDDVPLERGGVIRNRLKPAMLRAKNVETLAVGDAGTALRAAIERARSVKTEIRERVAAGEAPAVAGHAVNLTAITRAINWFRLPE